MKELIFNELTIVPLAPDFSEAFQRVQQFVNTYKNKPSIFDKRIRLESYIGELQLTEELSFQEFCNKTPASRTLGSLLLGLGRHPYIDEGSTEETQYLDKNYVLNRNGQNERIIGLAAAHLMNTICIGFESEGYWQSVEHLVETKEETGTIQKLSVLSVSNREHFDLPIIKDWVEKNQPVSLVCTKLESEEKKISLRDDHGKDVLQKFSRRVVKSPYVIGIVNSLPFNPNHQNFIKSVFETGLIEIVLTDTDKGLGIAVQTTGRNFRETEVIAQILEQKLR